MKLCGYLIVVISGLLYFCDSETSDEVFNDRECSSEGCIVYDTVDNAKWIDEETGKEWGFRQCLLFNSTINAHCKENYTYFGRTKISGSCISGDHFEYAGFCSDKDYRSYTENKDCIVPYSYFLHYQKWTLADSGDEISPGAYVRENQSILLHCDSTFDLPYGSKGIGKCQSGKWIFDANNCLTYGRNCENGLGCKLPVRKNSQWIDRESGIPLNKIRCVGKNISVTAVCHEKFSYFGKKEFSENCDVDSQWITSGDCTDNDNEGYEEGKDCIVPDPIKHGQWMLDGSEERIYPGTYIKHNTTIRTLCTSNYSLLYDGTEHVTKCNSGQWTYYYNSICVDASDYCILRSNRYCALPKHPLNGKWIHGITGKELEAGICVKPETTIKAVCNGNSSFFGKNNWRSICTPSDDDFARWTYEGFCTDVDFKGFEANIDCIVPEFANNTKWILNGTETDILPGTYVKEGTKIRSICNSHFELLYGSGDLTTCKLGRWTSHTPTCLDLSKKDFCSVWGSCVLHQHPENGKWIDTATGTEIKLGTCVKSRTAVTASCDNNFNYFGYKRFTTECYFSHLQKPKYSCTDQNAGGYVPNKDCIVPKSQGNSTWTLPESNEEILSGTYVKENSKIRSLCSKNFTRGSDGIVMCEGGKWQYDVGSCKEIYAEKISNNSKLNFCLIPDHPDNGQWVTWDSRTLLTPGTYVKTSTQMSVACKKNYKNFSTVKDAQCILGRWVDINDIGLCEVLCDQLNSTEQYKVTCISNNKRSENCTEPLDSTIAEITCKPVYQNLHIWESRSKLRVCSRGRWNNNVFPNCIPKSNCGLKPPNLQPLIVHGTEVSKGGYPWHVAIYSKQNEKRKLICGGTLISDRLIITAAHCITTSTGKLFNETMYEVAVGKQFSQFNDSRDEFSQSSTIMKMFVPETYKGGLKNFAGDIAILVSTDFFNLHDGVLPICVNFGTDKFEEKLLMDEKSLAHVPGFGRTETGNVSETLKEIAVPYVKHEKCSKYLPQEFIEYYSYDKFCAGHLNQSMSVCNGDSGGGLVIQNPQDKRFYLTGIVSSSPIDIVGPLKCNIQQYALYTKVAEYIDFISDEGGEYIQISIQKKKVAESPAVKACQNYINSFPSVGSDHEEYIAYPGEFPFLAIIGTERKNKTRWYCSGNVISDRFVLTAASCASNKTTSSIIVMLGIHEYDTPLFEAEENLNVFRVEQTYVLPDYNPPQVYNDIALFKLNRKVEFSHLIRPACLNVERNSVPEIISVKSGTWATRESLLVASLLETQKTEECERYFRRASSDALPEGVVDDVQFCVKPIVYRGDEPDLYFCKLFHGEPFPVVKNDSKSDKRYYSIVGITSYAKECHKVNNIVLFTKVSAFIPWIEGIVWPSDEK